MLYVSEKQNSGLISNKNFMFFSQQTEFEIFLQMHNKKNLYLEIEGNDYGVQHRNGVIRWQIKIFKSHYTVFVPAVMVSDILTFTNVDLETIGQGHRMQHTQ